MNKSEEIKDLAKALGEFQAEVDNATKKAVNPAFKSKYADLAEILNTVREPLTKRGLSFVQLPSFESGIVSVETVLMHTSGQWISSTISGPVVKQDPQGVGSAITYFRRYSLSAMCGIAQEDDDGNAASGDRVKLKDVKTIQWTAEELDQFESIVDRASAAFEDAGMKDRVPKFEQWARNERTSGPANIVLPLVEEMVKKTLGATK